MAGNNSSNSVGTRSSSRRFHNSSNSHQFCVGVDQFYQHPLVNVENSVFFELLRLLQTMGENFGAAETIRYVVAIEFKFCG
jgi:hypothetical protein